ncbi:MAG: ATP-binding protein [Vicinamibacterales bacterium]|nr:ATP-binding protein [Vicinamibacterales bacterium]
METARHYGIAIATIVVAFAAGVPLRTVADMTSLAFLLFTPAILVSAAIGGLGPGLLATLLGGLAGEYIFRDPLGIWPESLRDVVPLVIFLLLGIGISLLSENLAVARRKALDMAEDVAQKARALERAQEDVDRLARDVRLRARDFETLFDVAPIGIGIATDPECRNINVNPAFAELLQIETADNASLSAPLAERPAFVVTREGDPVPAEDLPLQRAARLGIEIRNVELDVERSDGSRVSLYEFAAPLFDEGGQVRGAIGAFLDITERRRAERAQQFLDAASTMLAASLDYGDTLQRLASLAVPDYADWCVLDIVGRQGGTERVAWAHRDPGQAARLADLVREYPPGPRADGTSSPFDTVRDGQSALINDLSPERLRRASVDDRQAETLTALGARSSLVAPLVAHGRVIGALSWTRGPGRPAYDERDRAVAEELGRRAATAIENARLYQEAQQANQLKDEFLATLSHEMRTPLNALLGWVQLLKSGELAPAKQARALEAIERSAQLQAGLTAEILDVSRAITGKLRLDTAPVDPAALVTGVIDTLRPAADSKGLRLDVQVPSDLPAVLLDAPRMQQVVWNLLSNAIKFTPAGEILVRLTFNEDRLRLDVSDTGIGIPASFLPFVFDRFRQADATTTRAFGGLGLGLSIARHIVELHGGTIEARSDGEGQGSQFAVVLPAVVAPAATERAAARDDTPAVALKGLSVLVVDDDPEGRELVRTILEEHGALVSVSASVSEAFEIFETEAPHLVVTDVAMPDEDGFVLLARIRARGPAAGGGTPVVALSAHARPEDRSAALAAGFQAHLTKPIDAATLVRALAGLRERL